MNAPTHPAENLPTHYSIGIGELIAIVWRRKSCLALCLIATLALGGVYYLKAERVYEVRSRLLVEKQELPIGESSSAARASRDLEFLGTQAEILGSAAVMEPVVERIGWPTPPQPGVSPVTMLKEKMSVRPVLGTNVLSVTLQADNAERAVEAIHALIASYREYMQQAEHDEHVEVLGTLAQSEKEVRAELARAEQEYRALRERSPLIAPYKNGTDVQLALVDQLGRKLAEMRGRRVELENQLRIASAGPFKLNGLADAAASATSFPASLVPASLIPTRLVSTATTPASSSELVVPTSAELRELPPSTLVGANLPGARDIGELQNQIIKAKALERELYSRFGEKHPEVKAVAEQLASLLAEEQKVLRTGHELLRRELETVTANEKQLSEMCKAELDQAKSLDQYHLQEQQMIGQLTRLQGVHDSLIAQLRQWKLTGQIVSEGRSPIRISVLEAPVVPVKPVWPSKRILLGICTALGLITGFSMIAFLEQRSRTQRLAAGSFAASSGQLASTV